MKSSVGTDRAATLVVAGLAAALLLWNLGVRYLWQDEAACAVMAERLMETGAPRGYDGVNLITMDFSTPMEIETIDERTGDPFVALRHYVEKGDFKDDTTWTGQPLGQFLLAGLSMAAFGKGTFQARLPFALCAVLASVVFFRLCRRRFADPLVACIAVALLLGNVYWLLHMRQCRLYAPSSLLLVTTLASYLRWQDGRRFGALLFGASAWTWFQFDFGTVWPALAVLGVDALRSRSRGRVEVLAVFAAIGAVIAPFVFYYEMFDRLKDPISGWVHRVGVLASFLNRYQLPFAIALVAWALRRWRSSHHPPGERRVIGLALWLVGAQFLWITSVSPYYFYRYVVGLTPLSCLVVAWVVIELAAGRAGDAPWRPRRAVPALLLGAIGILTPWFTIPATWVIPKKFGPPSRETGLRWELRAIASDLGGNAPDPNREVVEFLRPRLGPQDEVLINYEDVPLMFYLDNPIRGGIPCFRVEDPEGTQPRFCVLRHSADHRLLEGFGYIGFIPPAPYRRVLAEGTWIERELGIKDVKWSNNPDPLGHYSHWLSGAEPIEVFERVD